LSSLAASKVDITQPPLAHLAPRHLDLHRQLHHHRYFEQCHHRNYCQSHPNLVVSRRHWIRCLSRHHLIHHLNLTKSHHQSQNLSRSMAHEIRCLNLNLTRSQCHSRVHYLTQRSFRRSMAYCHHQTMFRRRKVLHRRRKVLHRRRKAKWDA